MFISCQHTGLWLRFLRGATAWCSAGMVAALTWLSASPHAHEELHEDAHHEEHRCAIVLFAQGLVAALTALCAVPALIVWRNIAWALPLSLRFSTPRFLRPPGRGPPR